MGSGQFQRAILIKPYVFSYLTNKYSDHRGTRLRVVDRFSRPNHYNKLSLFTNRHIILPFDECFIHLGQLPGDNNLSFAHIFRRL